MIWALSGSRRNPHKSMFVVQTSQDMLGQHSMFAGMVGSAKLALWKSSVG
jgi:hypothetical protein